MNYSLKTTNKSFINMWRYLQRNNVENNLFMLKTNRQELVDFSIDKYMSMDREDPYFKIYKSKIIDEARENIWFYFRELIVVPDETTLSGYKHFELTPESMMMIYLYDKRKSFINLNSENEVCLHFLWNLHRSLYNTDLVLINDINNVINISNNIKKNIAKMSCQIPFGSTQIMSDNNQHFLNCGLDKLREYFNYNRQSISIELIDQTYNNYIKHNEWVDTNCSIFVIENNLPILSYSSILNSIKNKYKLYLNGLQDTSSIDAVTLNNFLHLCYPKANTNIYDIDENNLNDLYLI